MPRKSILSKTIPEAMAGLKGNLVQTIKDFFNETPNSVLFWNGMLYLAFIIGLFIEPEFPLAIVTGLGSILVLAMVLDNDEDFNRRQLWIPLTGIFWVGLLIFGIGISIYGLYTITIKPFNAWLNKKPKEKQFTLSFPDQFDILVNWLKTEYTAEEAITMLHRATITHTDYTNHRIIKIEYKNNGMARGLDIVQINSDLSVTHLNPYK